MIRVVWPTTSQDKKAQVWRVLDLSGLTKSVRESKNFTRAGFVYLDGVLTTSLKDRVSLGRPFTLELRFPNGKTKSEEIMLVPRVPETGNREFSPLVKNYRG